MNWHSSKIKSWICQKGKEYNYQLSLSVSESSVSVSLASSLPPTEIKNFSNFLPIILSVFQYSSSTKRARLIQFLQVSALISSRLFLNKVSTCSIVISLFSLATKFFSSAHMSSIAFNSQWYGGKRSTSIPYFLAIFSTTFAFFSFRCVLHKTHNSDRRASDGKFTLFSFSHCSNCALFHFDFG